MEVHLVSIYFTWTPATTAERVAVLAPGNNFSFSSQGHSSEPFPLLGAACLRFDGGAEIVSSIMKRFTRADARARPCQAILWCEIFRCKSRFGRMMRRIAVRFECLSIPAWLGFLAVSSSTSCRAGRVSQVRSLDSSRARNDGTLRGLLVPIMRRMIGGAESVEGCVTERC